MIILYFAFAFVSRAFFNAARRLALMASRAFFFSARTTWAFANPVYMSQRRSQRFVGEKKQSYGQAARIGKARDILPAWLAAFYICLSDEG